MIERHAVAHHVGAICVPRNIEATVHHGHAVGWVDHGLYGLEAAGEQIRGETFCLKQLNRLGLARRIVVQRAEGGAWDFFLQQRVGHLPSALMPKAEAVMHHYWLSLAGINDGRVVGSSPLENRKKIEKFAEQFHGWLLGYEDLQHLLCLQ